MDGAELSCPSWTLWSPDRNFPPTNIEWSGGGIEFPYKYTYIHIPMYTYRNTHTHNYCPCSLFNGNERATLKSHRCPNLNTRLQPTPGQSSSP